MPKYEYKGRTYTVPDNEVTGFLTRKPEAKPLEKGAPIATAVGISADVRGQQLQTQPPAPEIAPSTPRQSDIPAATVAQPVENQPSEANSPEIGVFSPMVAPEVGQIRTKLSSPTGLYAPKSIGQVAQDTLRADVAESMADPAKQFERALQVYQDSGEYERDKSKEVYKQKLPGVAAEWLDKQKVDIPVGGIPLTQKPAVIAANLLPNKLTGVNTAEQEDLVNRFIANTQEGRDYAAEYAEQTKWLDDQIVGLEAKIEDAEKNAPRVDRDVIRLSGRMASVNTMQSPENYEDLDTARIQLTKLKNAQNAVADGDYSGFRQAFNEVARLFPTEIKNIVTGGTASSLDDISVGIALQNKNNVFTKEADELLGQWQAIRGHERTFVQDLVGGGYQSVAFMSGMIAGSPIVSGITKGTATTLAGRLGGKLVAQAIGKTTEVAAGAAIRVATTPAVLADAVAKNAMHPGSFLDDWAQSATTFFGEYLTEGMGAALPGASVLGKAPKTRLGRISRKIGETTGIQGFATEVAEEQLATVYHAAMGDGQGTWADIVDPRQQGLILASVGLMQLPQTVISAAGYAAGMNPGAVPTKRSVRKGYDTTINALRVEFGRDAQAYIDDINERIDADENASNISPKALIKFIDELGEESDTFNNQQTKTLLGYAMARIAYGGYNRAKAEEVEAAAQRVVPIVDQNVNPQTGSLMTAKINGVDTPTQIVGGRIAQREDGSIDVENSDKQVYYLDANGKKQVISTEFVGEVVENIPRDEAIAQVTESVTAPIVARQQNDEVRPYEVGETVRASIDGGEVVGTVSSVDELGRYVLAIDTGQGDAILPVEPRQIVNEDNIRGIENDSEVLYVDENGAQQVGIASTNPQLYANGLFGLEDGTVIPITNVVGLASEWGNSQQQPAAETAPQSTQTEAAPAATPTNSEPAQTVAPQAEGVNIETIIANAPKQKDGTVDYDALIETDPEAFAALYESEEGANETRAELAAVSANIGKNIASAQKQLEAADTINKRKAARSKIAALTDRKSLIDRIISERYAAPVAEVAEVVEQTPTTERRNPARKQGSTDGSRMGSVESYPSEDKSTQTAANIQINPTETSGSVVKPKIKKPRERTERQELARRIPANTYQAALIHLLGGGRFSRQDFIRFTGYGSKDLGQLNFFLSNNGEAFDMFESEFYSTYRPNEYDAGFESNLDEIAQAIIDFQKAGGKTDEVRRLLDGRDSDHPYAGLSEEEIAEIEASESSRQTTPSIVDEIVRAEAETNQSEDVPFQLTTNHFAPIGETEFNSLVDRLKQTGLAKEVVSDPVQFREVLSALRGDEAMQVVSEMEQIKAQSQADGTFMKAPNGVPTNLTEQQWLQVRTRPFLDWFGDWINDPANASKVVDENGEPKVIYHGSGFPAEFTEFDTRKIGINGQADGRGFYFTDDADMAEAYRSLRGSLYSVFLNVRKPLNRNKKTITKPQARRILTELNRILVIEDKMAIEDGFLSNYVDVREVGVKNAVEAAMNEYETSDSDVDFVGALSKLAGIDETYQALQAVTGQDGVIIPKPKGASAVIGVPQTHYVVMNPTSIKSSVSNIGTFDASNLDIRMMSTPRGDVYGFVTPDGTVYLDGSRMNANTPIHEFGHLWNSLIRESNPELWARGAEIIRQSKYWADVNNNPAYAGLSDEKKVDEALAMAIGDKGASSYGSNSVMEYAGVKGWIYQAWEWIKSKLGIARRTKIEDMTLADFTELAVGELLGGKNLRNSSENSNFANENDSENGTRTETGLDNSRTMGSRALNILVGEQSQAQAISRTAEAADRGGDASAIRSAEEIEELEARGINPYFSKPNFRKALTEAAKENSVWLDASYLDDKQLMHDQRARGTSENNVYKNPDGKTLTKLNNLSYVTGTEFDRNFGSIIDRLGAHNVLFPDAAYRIKGFMANKNGFPALVLEQPYVDAERDATQEEINEYLQSHGFTLSGTRSWSNEHPVWSNGVYELFDARPANVLIGKDGNLYFIDTLPHSVEYMSEQSRVDSGLSMQEVSEMEQIRQRSVADGTFMLAPNGKKTNLTERQWLQVRTANFKKWFGDWEKAARIEKLRNSAPVEITGEEIPQGNSLKDFRTNAKEYGLNLREEYTNHDTGAAISVNRGSINEVVSHAPISEQIKSVVAIPQLIENAIYIDSQENTDKAKRPDIDLYDYYVAGMKIGGVDYTARLSIAHRSNGELYYDHSLTEIEKRNLIHQVDLITNQGRESGSNGLNATVKDTKLISILQTNSSKVVDENGEPRVVYHGSTHQFYEFTKDRGNAENHFGIAYYFTDSNFDAEENYLWSGDDLNSRVVKRTEELEEDGIDRDAAKEQARLEIVGTDGGIMDVFLNIRNPIDITANGLRFDAIYAYNEELDEYEENEDSMPAHLANALFELRDELEAADTSDTELFGYIFDIIGDWDGTSAYDIDKAMRSFEPIMYMESEDGRSLVSNEFIRKIYETMGFDGIIMDASNEFGQGRTTGRAMNIEDGVNHYIAFESNQIKSATDNTGEFSADNADIRFQSVGEYPAYIKSRRQTRKRLGLNKSEEQLKTDALRDELDAKVSRFANRFREAYNDRHLAAKRLIDLLRKNGAVIPDYNDFYKQATHLAGKNDAQLSRYYNVYQKPLNKAIAAIESKDFEYRDIESYLFLKHGIERNPWMRADAIRRFKENNPDATAEELEAFEKRLPRDFSGITAIEKNDINTTAGIFIREFEADAGRELVDNLWKAVRAATNFALKTELDAGLISKAQYNELTTRYKYYVPLRGHDAMTAEEKYHYTHNVGDYFTSPLIRAKGRTSRADSPVAYIYQMAQSAINAANKNILNQTIYRVATKDKTGLLSVNKTWYVRSGTDAQGVAQYESASPDYAEDFNQYRQNIEDFEARMKELANKGEAFQGRKKLNIGHIFIKPAQAREHEVHVWQNGEDYTVYINADPAIARAINGSNVVEYSDAKAAKWMLLAARNMAANFTTRNPAFMASNFERDLLYATNMLTVKEGFKYAWKFEENMPSSLGALQRYTRGKANMDNKQDRYLTEYILNGGKTGFSHILELGQVKKQIEREIKKMGKKANALAATADGVNAILKALQAMNDIAENAVRFSTYQTSRQMGRTIIQSIDDAKNVTVNFNKMGTGAMGAKYIRGLYLFTNASIQALSNYTKVAWEHKTRAMINIAQCAAWAVAANLFSRAVGGDEGEDQYWKLSDWDRQNNFCVYTPWGFIKYALPQELRAFYKVGDLFMQAHRGKIDYDIAIKQSLLGIAELIPLEPINSAFDIYEAFTRSGTKKGALAAAAILAPDFIKPFAEIMANRNFTGGIIYNEWANPELPGYVKLRTNLRGDIYAPTFLAYLAEVANNATGGDEITKGWVNINPDNLHQVMRGYFGGMYVGVTELIDSAPKVVTLLRTGEIEVKLGDILPDRMFVSMDDLQTSGAGLQSRYYKVTDEVKETLRRVKGYQKMVKDGKLGIIEFSDKIKDLEVDRANRTNNLIKAVKRIRKTLPDLEGEEQLAAERMMYDFEQQAINEYRREK